MSNATDSEREAHARVEQYQGYTNRETWALTLHVNNDQGLSEAFREVAVRAHAINPDRVQDAMKDLAETYFTPDGYYDTFGDVIQNNSPCYMAMQEIGSMWRVDWAEVTAALQED